MQPRRQPEHRLGRRGPTCRHRSTGSAGGYILPCTNVTPKLPAAPRSSRTPCGRRSPSIATRNAAEQQRRRRRAMRAGALPRPRTRHLECGRRGLGRLRAEHRCRRGWQSPPVWTSPPRRCFFLQRRLRCRRGGGPAGGGHRGRLGGSVTEALDELEESRRGSERGDEVDQVRGAGRRESRSGSPASIVWRVDGTAAAATHDRLRWARTGPRRRS